MWLVWEKQVATKRRGNGSGERPIQVEYIAQTATATAGVNAHPIHATDEAHVEVEMNDIPPIIER